MVRNSSQLFTCSAVHIEVEGTASAHCLWDALRLERSSASAHHSAVDDGADSEASVVSTWGSVHCIGSERKGARMSYLHSGSQMSSAARLLLFYCSFVKIID